MGPKIFTADEVINLMNCVEKYKLIVDCKKCDVISTRSKELTWEKIAEEYFALCGVSRQPKELKKKYANIKYSMKSREEALIKNQDLTNGLICAQNVIFKEEDMLDAIQENSIDDHESIDEDPIKCNESAKLEHPLRRRTRNSQRTVHDDKIKKKEAAWRLRNDVKKKWTEKYLRAQIEFATAEEKRREMLFQLQKDAFANEEKRKNELHEMEKTKKTLELSYMTARLEERKRMVNDIF